MRTVLTYDEVRAKAAEVVGERPDHIYEKAGGAEAGASCTYERRGEPSCVVGQIMFRLGWTAEELRALDTNSVSSTDIGSLINTGQIAVDKYETEVFLKGIQQNQDAGTPWGVALERAEARVNELRKVVVA